MKAPIRKLSWKFLSKETTGIQSHRETRCVEKPCSIFRIIRKFKPGAYAQSKRSTLKYRSASRVRSSDCRDQEQDTESILIGRRLFKSLRPIKMVFATRRDPKNTVGYRFGDVHREDSAFSACWRNTLQGVWWLKITSWKLRSTG